MKINIVVLLLLTACSYIESMFCFVKPLWQILCQFACGRWLVAETSGTYCNPQVKTIVEHVPHINTIMHTYIRLIQSIFKVHFMHVEVLVLKLI